MILIVEGDKTMQDFLNSLLGLLDSLLKLVLLLLDPKLLIPVIFFIIIFASKHKRTIKKKIQIQSQKKAEEKEYKSSTYYQTTQLPYSSVKNDSGRYGEYLTYKYLKVFETNGAKFLFNLYIPKGNGVTSEIDILMICKNGLFVFESKNYSGWIFGNENQEKWYQTLPANRNKSNKECFYNPIMQNASHIKSLKTLLGTEIPIWSIIVFSERCTLKNIQIYSKNIKVVNRYDVALAVSDICNHFNDNLLTESDIDEIYNKMFPFTQIDETVKKQHISNIHNNTNPQSIQHTDVLSKQHILPNQQETISSQSDIKVNVNNNTNTINEVTIDKSVKSTKLYQ